MFAYNLADRSTSPSFEYVSLKKNMPFVRTHSLEYGSSENKYNGKTHHLLIPQKTYEP